MVKFFEEAKKTYRSVLEEDTEELQRLEKIWDYPIISEYEKELLI